MAEKDYRLSPRVDQVGIQDRVDRITKRSVKNAAKRKGLHMALNMIDLTTLEGADTDSKVKQMCYKAQHLHDSFPWVANYCCGLCISKLCKNSSTGSKRV